MRITLPLLILLITVSSFYGQNSNNHTDPHKIVPPTQETFNVSKIDYSGSTSGEFSYQYPFAHAGFKIPVSLNYSSGVKVNDVGGSAGMSWQLYAGGTISRVVKDETDENHLNWKPETVNESTDLLKIRQASSPGNNIDTEYDWFNFSISNGLSGTFYIDKDLNAYVESNNKVKIIIETRTVSPESPYGKMLEFKIIDKEGNEYYFGGQEKNVERTRYESRGPDQLAFTGWYLYKIRYSDSKEVHLYYSLENITYYTSLDASFYVKQGCYPNYGYTYSDILKTKSLISSIRPRIESITSENNRIEFNYTEQRQDVFTDSSAKLLTNIKIWANQNNVQTYSLEYEHPVANSAASYYNIPYNEATTRYRHFLKLIKNENQKSQIDFEYESIHSIPARFSLNSDYFGYANGKNNSSPFAQIGPENNFGIFLSYQNLVPLSILSANKSVNPSLASVGNLTKITHPTKGVSEITYEPNKASTTITQVTPLKKLFTVNYNKCNLSSSTTSQSFKFISDGSPISFEGTASYLDHMGCGDADPTKDFHRLKITDITSNNVSPLTYKNNISTQLMLSYPLATQAGHQYEVEYSIFARLTAVKGDLTLTYNSITTTKLETELYGGSRVSHIRDSNIEGDLHTRKFYYTSLRGVSQMGVSAKNFNPSIITASSSQTSLLCTSGSTFPQLLIVDMHVASTNNLLNSFTDRNSKIFYSTVTEIVENKSAIEKTYSYGADTDGYVGRIPLIHSMPKSNYNSQFRNGLIKDEIHYEFKNNKFDTIQQKKYFYNHVMERKNRSYVFRENFMYTPHPGEDPLINISYASYENYYGSISPTMIINREFVEGDAIIKTIVNNYTNTSHHQLTSQTTTFPDSSLHETTYLYAHEKGKTDMIAANMVGIPLETEVKKHKFINDLDPKIISKTGINYEKKTWEGKELILPEVALSYDLQNPSVSTTEVLYKKYDSRGNLLQYNLKPDTNGNSGNPVTIIWGYNHTQPIAKIEGIGYDALMAISGMPSIITDLQTKSAADLDTATEQILITALDSVRKNSLLVAYQITTYTYNPLVGVTSITPPSGIREYYNYDTANRLASVKDVNGNILKEYQYHYKP